MLIKQAITNQLYFKIKLVLKWGIKLTTYLNKTEENLLNLYTILAYKSYLNFKLILLSLLIKVFKMAINFLLLN